MKFGTVGEKIEIRLRHVRWVDFGYKSVERGGSDESVLTTDVYNSWFGLIIDCVARNASKANVCVRGGNRREHRVRSGFTPFEPGR
jgi:hypothetical protein